MVYFFIKTSIHILSLVCKSKSEKVLSGNVIHLVT